MVCDNRDHRRIYLWLQLILEWTKTRVLAVERSDLWTNPSWSWTFRHHSDLQSGGGRQQSGPPVDAYVIEFSHDWTAVGALLVRWKVTNRTDSAECRLY